MEKLKPHGVNDLLNFPNSLAQIRGKSNLYYPDLRVFYKASGFSNIFLSYIY